MSYEIEPIDPEQAEALAQAGRRLTAACVDALRALAAALTPVVEAVRTWDQNLAALTAEELARLRQEIGAEGPDAAG